MFRIPWNILGSTSRKEGNAFSYHLVDWIMSQSTKCLYLECAQVFGRRWTRTAALGEDSRQPWVLTWEKANDKKDWMCFTHKNTIKYIFCSVVIEATICHLKKTQQICMSVFRTLLGTHVGPDIYCWWCFDLGLVSDIFVSPSSIAEKCCWCHIPFFTEKCIDALGSSTLKDPWEPWASLASRDPESAQVSERLMINFL